MYFINTVSISPNVNDWLSKSCYPRILHVFDGACNLINERREILSIVTPQIGNGPFNLVIQDDVLFCDHLNLESPVSVFPNQLDLGDLTIHTNDVKIWSPRPDWEMLHARRDNIAGGLKSCLSSWKSNKFDSLHQREALPRIEQTALAQAEKILPIILTNLQSPVSNLQSSSSLISALASADLPSSLIATQKLAGLGIGLTPSGDDFIMGAILAAWIIHPVDVARVLAAELTEVAAALTTSLSGAWLRSAGRGETGVLWHNFFDALISVCRIGNPTYAAAVQESTGKILAVGETSGADALAGFIGTLICCTAETDT